MRKLSVLALSVLTACGAAAGDVDVTRHACGLGLELRLVSSITGEPVGSGALLVLGEARGAMRARTLMVRPSAGAERTAYVAELELRFEERDARGTLMPRRLPTDRSAWAAGVATLAAPALLHLQRGGPSSIVTIDPSAGLALRARICPIRAPLYCDLHALLACDDP